MKEEFKSNLPWYVNGTLDAEEKAAIDKYVAEQPEAAAMLAWHRYLSERIKTVWKPDAGEVPGLERTLRAIRESAPHAQITAWEKFWHALGRIGVTPRVAGVAAIVLITLQAGLIGLLQWQLSTFEKSSAEYRGPPANTEPGPFIRVSFRMDTKEFDIRMLFVGLGATYVGGPSQLGDYYVFVSREHIDRTVEQLRASQYVEAANLVAKVPPIK